MPGVFSDSPCISTSWQHKTENTNIALHIMTRNTKIAHKPHVTAAKKKETLTSIGTLVVVLLRLNS